MDNNKEEAIKGYNEEKKILSTRLGNLESGNKNISTRGAIERRLKEIDSQITFLVGTYDQN